MVDTNGSTKSRTPGRTTGYIFFSGLALAAGISLAWFPRYWMPPARPHDLMFFYVPGAIWLQGGSPYNLQTFLTHPLWSEGPNFPGAFGYQPSSWWICIALAFLPLDLATRAFWYLNVLWLAVCAGILYHLVTRHAPPTERARRVLAVVAVGIYLGLTCVRENFATNQSVLLFTSMLMLGLALLDRGHERWAGIPFGLMLYKYSLGLWVILALGVARRRWQPVAIALALHVALCAVPVFGFPTPVTWTDFRASVDAYVQHGTISPFNPGVTTIRAIATQVFHLFPGTTGNYAVHAGFLGVGLVSFYLTRRAYASPTLRYAWIGLNLIWTPVAGFSHAYDFVIVLPLFVGLVLAHRELRPLSATLIGLPLAMLMVPMHVQLLTFKYSIPYHALWMVLLQVGVTVWLLQAQPRRPPIHKSS